MSRNNYWLACGLFCLLLAACSEEDGDGKDLDKPLIESGDFLLVYITCYSMSLS